MEIRKYQSNDIKEIAKLFYETVHTINKTDYSKEQLAVWATGDIDITKWDISFQSHHSFVALENDVIVGFGDIDETGYLDRLYVHKNFQGRGIATAICDLLEKEVSVDCIQVHASITAKPFFLKRGYKVIKEQEVERQGVLLTNYLMEKCL
ncbi:GNAT family N-acetyltransferase [Sphingobacterium paucimobilis]|uniref:N-acetyltransferase domain-containing protein n=1 Tax=Sphingobacterium paucimobilis HER1398 TaxID=1346330 RepID=U2J9J0_9SPHI|nr:GNAT family N-acetyltransferase [Sphingobacterium paucimobilis]ERJ59338.1 hypothetical protein M472_11190 [Sphingobacterium paucimobilis HER1398]